MSEPHEPIPVAPKFVERDLPLCPVCGVLVRRLLNSQQTPDETPRAYTCDLHGTVTPRWETWEIPTGDES